MRYIIGFICTTALFFLCIYAFDIGLNITPSLPRGFYIATNDDTPLERGDIVKFELDSDVANAVHAGRYTGARPLLKYILGIEGDTISIDTSGVSIVPKNKNTACVLSAPKQYDSNGNKTVSILESGVVPEDKLFVYSNHPGSFDSRYFGLIDGSSVTKMEKLLTF